MTFRQARLLILEELIEQRIDIAQVDPREIDLATIDLLEAVRNLKITITL